MLDSFLNFLISSQVQTDFFWLKMLFFAVSLLMIGYIFYFLFTTRWFKYYFWFDFVEFFTLKTYGSIAASFWWKRAKRKLRDNSDMETIRQVITGGHEAIGKILERMVPMFQASTFSERLARLGEGTFSDMEGLWKAHALYREIKKNPHVDLDETEVKQAIVGYQKALVDLGILK